MPKKYNKLPFKLVIRGQIYHLKISTVVNGQRIFIRESTHTADRTKAEEYAAKRFAQIVEQAEFRTNPNKLKEYTLDQAFGLFWEDVGKYHANANDTFSKISNLAKFFNVSLLLSQLTVDDIADFVRLKLGEGRKPATINRYLALLSAIFNLCKKRRIHTPEINVREFMKKEPAENVAYFADWSIINKILDNSSPHLQSVILAALYTGLRKSNILNLKWADIVNDEIVVKVKDSKYSGGKIHTVKMFPALHNLIYAQPHCSDYIFTFNGQRIKDIKTAWSNALQRAGLPHTRFHNLRHTHATWLLRDTGNIKFVQKSLGHSDSRITEKYAHIIDDSSAQILEQTFSHRPANVA